MTDQHHQPTILTNSFLTSVYDAKAPVTSATLQSVTATTRRSSAVTTSTPLLKNRSYTPLHERIKRKNMNIKITNPTDKNDVIDVQKLLSASTCTNFGSFYRRESHPVMSTLMSTSQNKSPLKSSRPDSPERKPERISTEPEEQRRKLIENPIRRTIKPSVSSIQNTRLDHINSLIQEFGIDRRKIDNIVELDQKEKALQTHLINDIDESMKKFEAVRLKRKMSSIKHQEAEGNQKSDDKNKIFSSIIVPTKYPELEEKIKEYIIDPDYKSPKYAAEEARQRKTKKRAKIQQIFNVKFTPNEVQNHNLDKSGPIWDLRSKEKFDDWFDEKVVKENLERMDKLREYLGLSPSDDSHFKIPMKVIKAAEKTKEEEKQYGINKPRSRSIENVSRHRKLRTKTPDTLMEMQESKDKLKMKHDAVYASLRWNTEMEEDFREIKKETLMTSTSGTIRSLNKGSLLNMMRASDVVREKIEQIEEEDTSRKKKHYNMNCTAFRRTKIQKAITNLSLDEFNSVENEVATTVISKFQNDIEHMSKERSDFIKENNKVKAQRIKEIDEKRQRDKAVAQGQKEQKVLSRRVRLMMELNKNGKFTKTSKEAESSSMIQDLQRDFSKISKLKWMIGQRAKDRVSRSRGGRRARDDEDEEERLRLVSFADEIKDPDRLKTKLKRAYSGGPNGAVQMDTGVTISLDFATRKLQQLARKIIAKRHIKNQQSVQDAKKFEAEMTKNKL